MRVGWWNRKRSPDIRGRGKERKVVRRELRMGEEKRRRGRRRGKEREEGRVEEKGMEEFAGRTK